jgi:hypothetical protein
MLAGRLRQRRRVLCCPCAHLTRAAVPHACREAEAAEARALEEADRRLQQTDPKASVAWNKGGDSRVGTTTQCCLFSCCSR